MEDVVRELEGCPVLSLEVWLLVVGAGTEGRVLPVWVNAGEEESVIGVVVELVPMLDILNVLLQYKLADN